MIALQGLRTDQNIFGRQVLVNLTSASLLENSEDMWLKMERLN